MRKRASHVAGTVQLFNVAPRNHKYEPRIEQLAQATMIDETEPGMSLQADYSLVDRLCRLPWGCVEARERPDLAPLLPLLESLPPATPPVGLLAGIEACIEDIDRKDRGGRGKRLWRARPWRHALAVAMGLLAGMAILFWLLAVPVPGVDGGQTVTALLEGREPERLLYVRSEAGGKYLALHYGGPARSPGRDLEVWRRAPGARLPRSLGLLGVKGTTTILPLTWHLRPGEVILVTEEPAGGSPLTFPTGRVLMEGIVRHGG